MTGLGDLHMVLNNIPQSNAARLVLGHVDKWQFLLKNSNHSKFHTFERPRSKSVVMFKSDSEGAGRCNMPTWWIYEE